MKTFMLRSYGVSLRFWSGKELTQVFEGFKTLFPRRYLPVYEVSEYRNEGAIDAEIRWLLSDSFIINSFSLGEVDKYIISSPPPQYYVNEAPFFFVLQVLSRKYVSKGLLMFTDTVSVLDPYTGKASLIMGYPHTGKSTLLAIALAEGYVPLTTENTLVRVRDGMAEVFGGTDVLVYDPAVNKIYNLSVEPDYYTKHGYGIIDLSSRRKFVRAEVKDVYIIYSSFTSKGFSSKPVKGRKALKTLWHFANSVVRGLDFYEPYPLNLADPVLDSEIIRKLNSMSENYRHKFYEVFGSHYDIFRRVFSSNLEGD